MLTPNGFVQPAPANQPTTPTMFMTLLGRIIGLLLSQKAHVDIVIQLKDGKIQLVRMNQSFLPSQMPRV